MADLDLATALNMFKQGAQDLGFQRALASANDQIQQVKGSEMNEQQQRSALQNISNQLTMHMAATGVPATTMQAVQGAVGPKQYANANAMNADAVLRGDTGLADEAKQQQSFEQDPEYRLQIAKAKSDPMNAMKALMFNEKKDEYNTKQFADFQKDIDLTHASSRSAYGLTGSSLQKASRIDALMGNPQSWQNVNNADATLVGEGLSNLVKGGVATDTEIKALVPHTTGTVKSDVAQFLTSKPQPAQLQAFMEKYSGILDREKQANLVQAQDTVLSRATGNMKLNSRDPDQFKRTVATNMTQAGMPTNPEDVVVTPRGVTTVQMLHMNEKTAAVQDTLKTAYKLMGSQSSSSDDRGKAQHLFDALGIPANTPPAAAMNMLKRRIRSGDLEI